MQQPITPPTLPNIPATNLELSTYPTSKPSSRLYSGRVKKGRKTFYGETRIGALIDQEAVEKMGVL